MMSPLDIIAVVAALVVFVGRWEKLRHERFVIPGTVIGVTGGGLNAYAGALVSGVPASVGMIFLEAVIMSAMAIGGFYLAEEAGLPGLWRRQGLRARTASMLAGMVLVGSIGIVQRLILKSGTAPYQAAWVEELRQASNSDMVIWFLAIQAGLVEETLYRLFAISGVTILISVLATKLNRKAPRPLAIGVAVGVSALMFGLTPSHAFLPRFTAGVLLGLGYVFLGALPMIAGHIVGDLLWLPGLLK